jgi:hypothetical protein
LLVFGQALSIETEGIGRIMIANTAPMLSVLDRAFKGVFKGILEKLLELNFEGRGRNGQ